MHLGAALIYSFIEVELLIGCGGFTAYQFLTNSECYKMFLRSEGMGAKVHVRITLHLNAFRGVRAISEFDWPFTPTHRSSEDFSTSTGSVLHCMLLQLQPAHG